ncbi:MAG: hypothetical protein ABI408_00100 [Gemmatimonadaceae bacterium]
MSALLIGLAVSTSGAQGASRGAPAIRVYSRTGGGVASNYVEPAIQVFENAYVFAVSLDLDGQIQVLYPDFPGLSVRIRQNKQLTLPSFFAGFSQERGGLMASYNGNQGYSRADAGADNDSRGTVIALASRAAFNLARIESGGDWNIAAIRGLIEYRSPAAAAQSLAAYIGASGEPIGRDFMRFASPRKYYASNYADELYSCSPYSPSLAFGILSRVAQLRAAGQTIAVVGYNYCGMPIVLYGPSGGRGVRPPIPNPADAGDSRNRLGHGAPPRSGHPRAALGYFSLPRRAEPPQAGDVTVTAPPRQGRDPRQIFIDLANQNGGSNTPDRNRAFNEPPPPPRHVPAAAVGAEPVRSFNQPVRTIAPPPRTEPTRSPPPSTTQAPAPPRTPEPRTPPPSNPPPPKR